MRSKILIIAILLIRAMIDSCTGQTNIKFGKTINLLEHIQPAVVPTYGKKITGFKMVVPSGELKRSMTAGPLRQLVTGTRSGDPPCPFVNVEHLMHGTNLISRLDWVGNVPGDDISDDRDCTCETHLAYIYFHGIYVYYSDGSMVAMPEPRLPGKYVLCPNQQEGHLIGGSDSFNGPVETVLSLTLRVADDDMSLLADIEYTLTAER